MSVAGTVTVLVHGLWLHGVAMQLQRRYLARMGFDVICYSYPTVRCTLTENIKRLAEFARSLKTPRIHWVGHSLGGIVILRLLERTRELPPGRVVLLGVPCNGSHSGRALAGNILGAYALGHCVREWLASPALGPFGDREIGSLAGSAGIGLGRVVARGLPKPNDGTITVTETELAAACDRIVLPVSHTSMLLSRNVAHQTSAFLRHGRFDHAGA
jgi:pimeloyl-ACP methyl ester carboxylesterase